MPRLVASSGHSIELGHAPSSLGRSPQNTIPIHDGLGIAEFQFCIRPDANGRFWIKDLTEGRTFLNGQPFSPTPLKQGDMIQAGQLVLFWDERVAEPQRNAWSAAAPAVAEHVAPPAPATQAACAEQSVAPVAQIRPVASEIVEHAPQSHAVAPGSVTPDPIQPKAAAPQPSGAINTGALPAQPIERGVSLRAEQPSFTKSKPSRFRFTLGLTASILFGSLAAWHWLLKVTDAPVPTNYGGKVRVGSFEFAFGSKWSLVQEVPGQSAILQWKDDPSGLTLLRVSPPATEPSALAAERQLFFQGQPTITQKSVPTAGQIAEVIEMVGRQRDTGNEHFLMASLVYAADETVELQLQGSPAGAHAKASFEEILRSAQYPQAVTAGR